jgi:hypothetical protein
MCFNAAPVTPVEIPYQKQEFGPLEKLPTGTPVDRAMPVYANRTTTQARSLLMPFTMGGS